MENSKRAGDNRCRYRTNDEPFEMRSDAAHYKCLKRPRVSENVRNSRMPNLNTTLWGENSGKTQLCCDFNTRGCSFGDHCRYTHEFGSYGYLCKWFSNGMVCPYGNRCRFIHQDVRNVVGDGKNAVGGYKVDSSVRVKREHKSVDMSLRAPQEHRIVQSSIGTGQENRHVDSSLSSRQRTFYWKTKLCNKWETLNECPYGSRCCYAHGLAELLPGSRYGNVSSASVVGRAKDKDTRDAQVEGNNGSIKWKTFNKLIGIYADWIDDMPTQPDI